MPFLRFYFILFAFFYSFNLFAQGNTLVTGSLSGESAIKFIELRVNESYLNGEVKEYYSNVLEDGSFAFSVQINQGQLVRLKFGENSGMIYLEPGDSLHIYTDVVNFQRAFAFTGKAAENNRYLSKYYKENPTEANPFKLVQYRQGIHWYDISPEMDTKMRNFTSEEYIHLLNDRKEKALSSLLAHEKYHPNSTSNDFKKYIEAEIIYDWAYHILAHGHIYEKIKSIERSYFDLLSNVSLTNDQIGNFRYRQYLKAYMDKMYMFDAVKADNPYLGIYRLSESRLSGQSKEFVQSEMICTGFSKKYISELIPVYEEFLHGCSNSYSEKVAITFEEAMQNAVGSAASNFVIRNSQAEEVTLNSLKGKTIYLNFWASWCQPCVRKMLELKDLEGELKNSNVEFVHISFDRDESTWASTIRSFNFKGIHALATDGVNSELAKAYGVRAIPQYFIINKEGKFAPKPTTHSVDELKKILVSLDSK